MYKLEAVYGKAAYDEWGRARPEDLRPWRQSSADASSAAPWPVRSYDELLEVVSFLAVMNKRLTLVFRGQHRDFGAVPPSLFRPTWDPPAWSGLTGVELGDRAHYASQLSILGEVVFEICRKRGIPRFRALRDVHEARWAVVQHYELWPTPLLDVTSSLRTAATFALERRAPDNKAPSRGVLYVAGLPGRTSSISFHLDDQLVVAHLASVCPPIARRPHLQEGLLVGRFPMDDLATAKPRLSDLRRRLVARIDLIDVGGFWSNDFPRMRDRSLLPEADLDPLAADFQQAIAYELIEGRVKCHDVRNHRERTNGELG